MAQLRTIIAQLRSMDNTRVTQMLRSEIAKTARPFAPAVRARILNIPTYGIKHTGLRIRIAACVQTWAEINGPVVSVGVEVNSSRMPSGQYSLPILMEGVRPWRHPLFGDRERWYGQDAHPYFYEAVAPFGPASRNAIERVLDQITRDISG